MYHQPNQDVIVVNNSFVGFGGMYNRVHPCTSLERSVAMGLCKWHASYLAVACSIALWPLNLHNVLFCSARTLSSQYGRAQHMPRKPRGFVFHTPWIEMKNISTCNLWIRLMRCSKALVHELVRNRKCSTVRRFHLSTRKLRIPTLTRYIQHVVSVLKPYGRTARWKYSCEHYCVL